MFLRIASGLLSVIFLVIVIMMAVKGDEEVHVGFFFLPFVFGVYAIGGNELFNRLKQ